MSQCIRNGPTTPIIRTSTVTSSPDLPSSSFSSASSSSSSTSSPSPSSPSLTFETEDVDEEELLSTTLANATAAHARPLDKAEIDEAIEPFMVWLSEPPMTIFAQKVKHEPAVTPAQQARHRGILRRIFKTVHLLLPTLFEGGLYIGGLVHSDTVRVFQRYQQTTRDRESSNGHVGVGASVQHTSNLMLSKLIVYLAEEYTKRTGINKHPSDWPAWLPITSVSHAAGRKRKQERMDNVSLGHLAGTQQLTEEQVSLILDTCLTALNRIVEGTTPYDGDASMKTHFSDVLIVSLFVMLGGVRPESLAGMTTQSMVAPQTGDNRTSQYEFRLRSAQVKHQKAQVMVVPTELTAALEFYLQRLLPQGYKGPLWMTRNGDPRSEFTDVVNRVAGPLLGRKVSPYDLRRSLATQFARYGTTEERRQLAEIQGHSLLTQEQYYIAKEVRESQRSIQQKLMEAVNKRRRDTAAESKDQD